MADTRQKSETKKRRKALVVGSSAVVLVVGSIGCIQYVKTVLAKQAYYRRHDVKYSVKIYDAASEAKAEAERKKYFDRALMLRDKWKPWAEQHRDLLTRMQHAKVSDPRIFAEALDALPSHVGYDGQRGITHADLREFTKQKTSNLGNPNQIPHAPVGMRWTWDVIKPPKQYFYDAALAAEYQKSLDSIAAYRKEDFASHRDIVLTRSMGASRSHFLLWASGRLTETTKQLDGNVKDEAEIAPPFDFVQ